MKNESEVSFRVLEDILKQMKEEKFDEKALKSLIETLLSFVWDKLHSLHWKDVPLIWREMYYLFNVFLI
jgi:hypothetical protein